MIDKNMGGGRNGRLKWVLGVAACVVVLYLVYLQRDTNHALQEKEKEQKRMEDMQGRLAGQLKDLAQSHTSLQEELKTEKVNHQRTRMGVKTLIRAHFQSPDNVFTCKALLPWLLMCLLTEKSEMDKQYKEDLKNIKETAESEKYKIEQERDGYKIELESVKEAKQRIQEQQDSLLTRYDQDINSCESEKKKNEEQLNFYRDHISKTNNDKEEAQEAHSQCQTKMKIALDNLKTKDYELTTAKTELSSCQSNLQMLKSKKDELQTQLSEIKKQGATRRKIQNPMMDAIKAKLGRGEQLTEDELRAYSQFEAIKTPQVKKQPPPEHPDTFHDRPAQNWKFGSPGNNGMAPGRVGGMEQNHGGGGMEQVQQLPDLADHEEVKELELEEQEAVNKERREEDEGDEGVDEKAFKPAEKEGGERNGQEEEEEEGRDYGVDGDQQKKVEDENMNLPVPDGQNGPPIPHPDRVLGGPKPRFENPDQAFDNQDAVDEQEEMEKEQEGDNDDGIKVEEDDDQFGHKQFEEDMKLDREERQNTGPEWNRNWGRGPNPVGMKQRPQVDQAMRKEMNENDLRRQQVVNHLQQQNIQKRLDEDQQLQRRVGHRDNLR